MMNSNATRGGARPGAGRPRRSSGSLHRAFRERFSDEAIVELAAQLAESAESEQVRLSALQMITERIAGKVTDKLAIGPAALDDADEDLDADLTLDQLRAQVALDEQYERARVAIREGAALALPSTTGLTPVVVGTK